MSTTSQAYGLVPAFHGTGQNRANKYNILNNSGTGYGSSIFKGDIVALAADGTINIIASPANSACLGVFAGCEYIDPTGKPVESAYWPASTAVLSGSEIKAYVYDDPYTVFKVGVTANASGYVQTNVGDQATITNNGTGNTNTGVSAGSVATAAVGTGTAAMVRIIGFADGIYDATTNPYPQLLVQLNKLQFTAGGNAI